jgi:hypothetical protein
MKKRIKFIKGILLPYIAEAYDTSRNDVEVLIKMYLNIDSFGKCDGEQLDEAINFMDQLLLEKNIDINETIKTKEM